MPRRKGRKIMDYFRYLPNRGIIKINDPKTSIATILLFMISAKIIMFHKRKAYLDCGTYWCQIDDDTLGDILKYLVGLEMAATIPESQFDSIVKKMKSSPELRVDWDEEYRRHQYEVNLSNGTYDILKRNLIPDRSEHPFTYVLNAEYILNSHIRQAPNFQRFVETSIGTDNYDCILHIIGYVLSSLTKGRKAFVFQGKGGTGKSTLLNWLEAVVGEQFVSREPFHSMGSQNSLARYVNKRVNISRENGVTPMRNEDGFKSLISCEGITGRDVYSKAVSYVPTLKFVFGSNHDLCFKHPDDAVYDRLLVIKFTREIAKKDLELDQKLYDERHVIVSLALDSLKEFVESGYDFKESQTSKKYIELKRKELHAAEAFLQECCEIHEKGKVSKQALLRAYEVWSEQNSFPCIGRNEFYDRVRNHDSRIKDQKVSSVNGRVNGFSGITLKGAELWNVDSEANDKAPAE